MNPGFLLAYFQQLEDSQPMRKQDLFSQFCILVVPGATVNGKKTILHRNRSDHYVLMWDVFDQH